MTCMIRRGCSLFLFKRQLLKVMGNFRMKSSQCPNNKNFQIGNILKVYFKSVADALGQKMFTDRYNSFVGSMLMRLAILKLVPCLKN